MKLKRLALLLLVTSVAGWVGYYLGVMRETSATHMPRGATVPLDYLVSAESFSEVEHARAVLNALALRYVESAQGLIVEENMSRNGNSGVRKPSADRPIVAAINMLGEAISEFKGTGVELRLLPPLLHGLKQERLYDRWLDVYLDALYQHPTHELVGDLAEEAVIISRAVGREKEIIAGLTHLANIPLDFHTKSRIERSLVSVSNEIQIACENHELHL